VPVPTTHIRIAGQLAGVVRQAQVRERRIARALPACCQGRHDDRGKHLRARSRHALWGKAAQVRGAACTAAPPSANAGGKCRWQVNVLRAGRWLLAAGAGRWCWLLVLVWVAVCWCGLLMLALVLVAGDWLLSAGVSCCLLLLLLVLVAGFCLLVPVSVLGVDAGCWCWLLEAGVGCLLLIWVAGCWCWSLVLVVVTGCWCQCQCRVQVLSAGAQFLLLHFGGWRNWGIASRLMQLPRGASHGGQSSAR